MLAVATCLPNTLIHIYHNPPFSTSAVTLTPPPPPRAKACPQALYVRITPIRRSYLYAFLVAYYLYYTSILSIYLGTLVVQIYQDNQLQNF